MWWPERAWPVAPRPFDDETFGSWFGRVASRYRLGVDELAESAGVALRIDATCRGWLTMPPPDEASLQRLARLSRIPSDRLASLGYEGSPSRSLVFCHFCLFLNPVAVEDPYWHAGWLLDTNRRCATHGTAFSRMPISVTEGARNLTRLLRRASNARVVPYRWERTGNAPSALLARFEIIASRVRDDG